MGTRSGVLARCGAHALRLFHTCWVLARARDIQTTIQGIQPRQISLRSRYLSVVHRRVTVHVDNVAHRFAPTPDGIWPRDREEGGQVSGAFGHPVLRCSRSPVTQLCVTPSGCNDATLASAHSAAPGIASSHSARQAQVAARAVWMASRSVFARWPIPHLLLPRRNLSERPVLMDVSRYRRWQRRQG